MDLQGKWRKWLWRRHWKETEEPLHYDAGLALGKEGRGVGCVPQGEFSKSGGEGGAAISLDAPAESPPAPILARPRAGCKRRVSPSGQCPRHYMCVSGRHTHPFHVSPDAPSSLSGRDSQTPVPEDPPQKAEGSESSATKCRRAGR